VSKRAWGVDGSSIRGGWTSTTETCWWCPTADTGGCDPFMKETTLLAARNIVDRSPRNRNSRTRRFVAQKAEK